jgi:hypothetical protein
MASNNEAQDNGDHVAASGEDAELSHDALYADIAKARTRGVGNVRKPLLDLPSLLRVARLASSKEQDAEKIEDTLERAAKRLGGMSAPAVQALLGLDPETRGREVGVRRMIAAKYYDHKAPDSFRAHYEKQLLMALATELFFFVDKQRIEDQQRRLTSGQGQVIEAQQDLIRHNENEIGRMTDTEQALQEAAEVLERTRPKAKVTFPRVFRSNRQD